MSDQAVQFEGPGAMFKPRVSHKMHDKCQLADVLAFFRQLNTLFNAGTPIYESILIAADQTESKALQRTIHDLAKTVASGSPLSDAFSEHPKVFKEEWCQIIRGGEISGTLGETLVNLAGQIDEAQKFRAKVRSSLAYPMTILFVSIIAVTVMLVVVVPTFQKMFADFGKELPAPTQMLIALSEDLRQNGVKYITFIALGVVAFRKAIKTKDGGMIWTRFLMSVPIVGDLMVQASMQRFSQNVSILLGAGVPVLETIDAMKGIYSYNPVYQNSMKKVAQHVGRGGNLSDAMESTGLFTVFMSNMARIGEQSGTLPEVLEELSGFYRTKVEVFAGRIASQIETILIAMMSVVVGAVLISLYLPLFEMSA
ncbi:MAG: type II secretion system F family protein [Planctomycetota bacterium]